VNIKKCFNQTRQKDRKKAQRRYQIAVKQAGFLDEQQKLNWSALGTELSTKQLEAAEQIIMEENLKKLRTKEALSGLKPKKI